MILEAYMQPDGSYIILDYGMSDHDIGGECTEDFAKLQISESYDLGSDSSQHIYKVIPNDGEDRIPFYLTSLQWYHSQFDESTLITTLKELDDIEDMLPFPKFQLAKNSMSTVLQSRIFFSTPATPHLYGISCQN
ncbi:hypothetical protein J7E52_08495 [Bacillus sp. ISL-34]|uniref:hypothetical protein n=1 Tax=Bacillus sp. ISL-34 TaxID=2819121 RepID=UPI001BE769FD|nr:hypothetical protein [Bacillus sp. ISL-34]MBT2646759.1 hypothetical protein [Bacillus sp. ISL-34]